jgi:hypothetical protein
VPWARRSRNELSGVHSPEAGPIATLDPIGEPVTGEVARNLRAVQRNLREHGARYGLVGQAIDEREHAYVNAALGERGILAEFEVVADVGVGEVESPCRHPNGELGAAGLDGGFSVLVAQKVAVELERNAGRLRDAALERRIPARVLARVEVGEAILSMKSS